jgi:hypothetical protein
MTIATPSDHTNRSLAELPVASRERNLGDIDAATEVARMMADLHFDVRERIGDLLTSPSAASLQAAHEEVEYFLGVELRCVLHDEELMTLLAMDSAERIDGRRRLRKALGHAVWSDEGSSALTTAVEMLRLSFLHYAAPYGYHRDGIHRAPSRPPPSTHLPEPAAERRTPTSPGGPP